MRETGVNCRSTSLLLIILTIYIFKFSKKHGDVLRPDNSDTGATSMFISCLSLIVSVLEIDNQLVHL